MRRSPAVLLVGLLVALIGTGTRDAHALAAGRCATSSGGVDQRVAAFWGCVTTLGPSDALVAEDLGQWARNVIELDPRACITVSDFRVSTGGMQAAIDSASAGIPPAPPRSLDVESRIAAFWARVGALGPLDLLAAGDVGQWALNVIDRDPSRQIRVEDFRASAAGMQSAFDRAKAAGALCAAAQPTASPSATPSPAAPRDFSAFLPFDDQVLSFMRSSGVPGGALAVVKDGRLVYANGYGLADVQRGAPVTASTLFRIASVSKPITAIAVMRLVEDGRISLDMTVLDYLQLTPFVAPGSTLDARVRRITVRNLLEHTGGWDRDISGDPIGKLAFITNAMGVPSPPTMTQFVSYMFGQRLDFDPGTRYAYSNLGYNVLGLVIQRATGMTYEAYVRSVLQNVGVTRAHIGSATASGEGEVTYYPTNTRTYTSLYAPYGLVSLAYGSALALDTIPASSGWVCSAVDLARVVAQFSHYSGNRLLSAASTSSMFALPAAPLWRDANGAPSAYWYAKGWDVRPAFGSMNVWHTGFMPGTTSLLVGRYDGLGWAVVFNRDVDVGPIDARLHTAAAAVRAWPSWDLFAELP